MEVISMLGRKSRKRLIGTAMAILLLLLAASFFNGAIAISRVNSLIAKSDARLETDFSTDNWRSFLQQPVQYWFVETMGYGDSLELRKIYVLLDEGKIQDAWVILENLIDSEDNELSSLALTLFGKIAALQAIQNSDREMFESARQMFGRASVLNPENEDAKYNLELLSVLQKVLWDDSDSSLEDKESNGIDLDELPGSEGGKPGQYSGY